MRQLFLFIYAYRAFFVFLVFEGFSIFLIIQNQNYHKAAFINSSNVLVGNIAETSSDISDYFNLKSQNEVLSVEVAVLKERIAAMELQVEAIQEIKDDADTLYDFIPAKVVYNSYRQLNNYLTLNKGHKDGIKINQGVIGADGIVGKIRSASENFSIVVSLLHTDFLVSSLHKRSGTFCTTNWDGRNPEFANLIYVPRHVFVNKGDTVTTSGYSSVFPANQFIGIVEEVNTLPNATFHDIRIKLATDFSQINFVSVVENKLSLEKDSIEHNAALVN